jgi:hypothetical protein
MSDITTGIFTVVGATIGAIGTQVTGIIRMVSKSRDRKQKAAERKRDENAARWRQLYGDFTASLRAAITSLASARTSLQTPGTSWGESTRDDLRQRLIVIRDCASQVQVDGSRDALKIATDVLSGIAEVGQLLAEAATIGGDVLDRVYEVLTNAETEMINLSRKDFGADAT